MVFSRASLSKVRRFWAVRPSDVEALGGCGTLRARASWSMRTMSVEGQRLVTTTSTATGERRYTIQPLLGVEQRGMLDPYRPWTASDYVTPSWP